jgi:hypothetical protein
MVCLVVGLAMVQGRAFVRALPTGRDMGILVEKHVFPTSRFSVCTKCTRLYSHILNDYGTHIL